MASVREAKIKMAEMHSNGSLAVLAPVNVEKHSSDQYLYLWISHGWSTEKR